MKRPGRSVGTVVVGLLVLLFVAMIVTTLTMVIWPGEFRLAGRVLCDDSQPDTFIVSDSYSVRPGETVTEFTLYCVGPAGDATDQGFFRPFLLMTVVHAVILLLVIGIVRLVTTPRRRRRRDPFAGPVGPPSGPIPPPPAPPSTPLIS
jgi:hypothetical protein